MLKAKGKFWVRPDTIKIVLDPDFCRFYRWFYDRAHYFTQKTQLPLHGAHIGIVNPKIHKGIDCTPYLDLNGTEVWFDYNIDGNYGGFTKKTFRNFWLDVFCKEAEDIQVALGIPKQPNYERFHITILNTKNL